MLSRLPRDSPIAGEKHMASLGFAVHAVIGPIGIQVPYKTIADDDVGGDGHGHGDADGDADADSIAGEV